MSVCVCVKLKFSIMLSVLVSLLSKLKDLFRDLVDLYVLLCLLIIFGNYILGVEGFLSNLSAVNLKLDWV